MSLTVKIIRLDKSLPVPFYPRPGDAGFDLYTREAFTVQPGERVQAKTGLKMEIPFGYVGYVWDKGSVGQVKGFKTLGGVVDAGYRGEILVGLVNLSGSPYTFEKGDKVAQMCIQKVENPEIVEVEELSESVRGEGGFGSTGK